MSGAAAALALGLAVAQPRRAPICPRCLLRGERVALGLEHVCEATEAADRCKRCRMLRQVRGTMLDQRGSLSELIARAI
jgi:hypothetical protein